MTFGRNTLFTSTWHYHWKTRKATLNLIHAKLQSLLLSPSYAAAFKGRTQLEELHELREQPRIGQHRPLY